MERRRFLKLSMAMGGTIILFCLQMPQQLVAGCGRTPPGAASAKAPGSGAVPIVVPAGPQRWPAAAWRHVTQRA
jgi:hypothetical protein